MGLYAHQTLSVCDEDPTQLSGHEVRSATDHGRGVPKDRQAADDDLVLPHLIVGPLFSLEVIRPVYLHP